MATDETDKTDPNIVEDPRVQDPYLSELDNLEGLDEPTQLDVPKEFPKKDAPIIPARVEQGGIPAALFEEEESPQEPERKAAGRKSRRLSAEFAADIPVVISVVLGSRELTLEELGQLKMGEVVELKTNAQQLVDLVAQGRVVAKGELVEIDGKLGVRVLKVC